jgi:hypothetical protein
MKEKTINKEKLKMEQKEYQLLLEKSKNILTISNNIKKLTQTGGNLINNIGSSIDSIEDNIINANEELEKYNRKKKLISTQYNDYLKGQEQKYEKILKDGENFLIEAYKALKIEKNFEIIKNRDDYINQLKGLDLMLKNKTKELNEKQNIKKKKKKKEK